MTDRSNASILVVDDDEAKRYSTARVLRAEGFEVREASDGHSALEMVKQAPDLIILDVRLPDISGLEVCRRIKEDPETARIPVIHLSGTFVTPEHRVKGLDSGADAYLSDTSSLGEVLATIRAFLRARRAEQAALESERRYRTLAEELPQLVWTCNPDGQCDYLNLRWVEYTGTPVEEHLGSGWLNALYPEDRRRASETWHNAVAGLGPYDLEFRIRRSDGVYRWFQTRGVPLRDNQNRIVKWLGTCTDIHLRKEAAAERSELLAREQAAREEAERANRIKDDFLATLSHELRTPLTAILGWTELLQMGQFSTEEVREALTTIHRNARAQSQLIDDLLDVSRIISGKMRLDVQALDLQDVIQSAIDSIRTAADAKEIYLGVLLDPAAGRIAGDPARLQQVVWNLLSNAIKFTPKKGRVLVRLGRVDDHVEIVVTDSGQGIDPDFLPHVFERFRQQDASSRRSQGGLGLGLAIVRHLVELHGGTIAADSEGLGQGATFTVRLPIAPLPLNRPATAEAPEPAAPPREPAPSSAEYDLSGVKILLVDDERDARELLSRILGQRQAQVIKAASADEAVQLFLRHRPDVLISDIGMPGQDGFDLIRKIRAAEVDGQGIAAVALTAFAREEDRQRALRAGFQAHVCKPLEPAELIGVVARLAGRA